MRAVRAPYFWRHPAFLVGTAIVGLVGISGLISLFWTPYDPSRMMLTERFQPPGIRHWLGTDHFGRDLLSMLMRGAVPPFFVAFLALALGLFVGTPLGLAAAARPSLWSDAIMRVNDFLFAIPALLTAMILAALYGPSVWGAALAIGLFNIPVFARLVYGEGRALWQREFVLSARAAGKSAFHISLEHIVPNLLNLLIVQSTILLSVGILAEAGLAYLGYSSQPPLVSWGRMLSDSRTYFHLGIHLALVPGLAIFFTVLGLNLLGDALRDFLDPRGIQLQI